MADVQVPRLNGVIKALEAGQIAFAPFSATERGAAQAINSAPYDGIVLENEHSPYDIKNIQDTMQYMLNRRQIVTSGTLAPAVVPMVRIPPNAGSTNWVAKQVLDIGVFGIMWPHIDSVEEARSAIQAMRYPKPEGHAIREPFGLRGDAPTNAALYWGLTGPEYYARADVWPLNPQGELLAILQIESPKGVKNLPKIIEDVPGIGVILIGEGDLSQELGHPREYDHPDVDKYIQEIVDICKAHNMPCGHPHVDQNNVEKIIDRGFRFLMPSPERTFNALNKGRSYAKRN
jgi:4-hydroxy-2-oxoheptanedioate aldolase